MLIPKAKIRLVSGKELRFALIFMLTFCILQFSYQSSRGGMVEHLVIDVATVYPGTALINFIDPNKQAMASGQRILSPQGSLSILNGCEGTETLFLLTAAIAAFRASWRNKLKGVLLGTCLVYCLNQVRIVSLFFAAQENRQWFDMIHGYIAPSLIVVLSSMFFLWWANAATDDVSAHTA
jgi:exosortase family protein XrtM